MHIDYPRPLNPGGFSLPPLVEDLIPILTPSTTQRNANIQTDLLLIRPTDMESLWEWYAYTKLKSDGDPSWGRVWPTATSLAQFLQLSLRDSIPDSLKGPMDAIRSCSHLVELGCGLGVVGLTYSLSVSRCPVKCRRTVTFLDREQYALHCVMSSAVVNGLTTAPIDGVVESGESLITVRAALDDWTTQSDGDLSQIQNIWYDDLHLDSTLYENEDTIIVASDVLYETSSMNDLAIKIQRLLHPTHGGYALLSDPVRERTRGCRALFVASVEKLGGDVVMVPMSDGLGGPVIGSSDSNVESSWMGSILIVVRFCGDKNSRI